MRSTDETRKISGDIRRQAAARQKGSTGTIPVGIVGPEEREREQRLRRQAEAELAEEQVQQKMAEIRQRGGFRH